MSCNDLIHKELSNEFVYCCFCNEKIFEPILNKNFDCCDKPNIINNNNAMTCGNCGLVIGCEQENEYIDYIENKYKIKHNLFYRRKHYINKILLKISSKSKINISYQETQKIIDIFEILPIIYKDRKRKPSIPFVIKKILELLNNNDWMHIETSKNKEQIIKLENYWYEVMKQVGDEISLIVHR